MLPTLKWSLAGKWWVQYFLSNNFNTSLWQIKGHQIYKKFWLLKKIMDMLFDCCWIVRQHLWKHSGHLTFTLGPGNNGQIPPQNLWSKVLTTLRLKNTLCLILVIFFSSGIRFVFFRKGGHIFAWTGWSFSEKQIRRFFFRLCSIHVVLLVWLLPRWAQWFIAEPLCVVFAFENCVGFVRNAQQLVLRTRVRGRTWRVQYGDWWRPSGACVVICSDLCLKRRGVVTNWQFIWHEDCGGCSPRERGNR